MGRISPAFPRRPGALAGGTVYRNGYQSHAATETCPGHSTILTGQRPATQRDRRQYLDRPVAVARADKTVYCAEDERVPGSTSTAYTVSPYHLNAPTLGDLLKARSPASRNVAVAGKDRSAVMMSGRNVDQRWYWDGKTFVTDLKGAAMSRGASPPFNTPWPPRSPRPAGRQAAALCQAKARVPATPDRRSAASRLDAASPATSASFRSRRSSTARLWRLRRR